MTRKEAQERLGITSPTAFHSLKKVYPGAFRVIQPAKGRSGTLYDDALINELAAIRERLKELKKEPV
jgi:hypothetical protein